MRQKLIYIYRLNISSFLRHQDNGAQRRILYDTSSVIDEDEILCSVNIKKQGSKNGVTVSV